MARKTQIPMKHKTKKVGNADRELIEQISLEERVPYVAAKHAWYESQEPGNGSIREVLQEIGFSGREPRAKEEPAEEQDTKPEDEKHTRATRGSPIAETKLGVTLVLSHEDCENLGYDLGLTTTSTAIDDVRERLGLKSREAIKSERKAEREANKERAEA